jgi:hypothetical protein
MWDSPTSHFGGSPHPASGCGHAPEPSLSIDIDEEGRRGQGGDEKQAACLFFIVCFEKLLCDNIQVGSWPVMAKLFTPFPFQGRIQPLD